MHPIDHFFSQIDSSSRTFRGDPIDFGSPSGKETRDRLLGAFTSLAGPVIGKDAASDLCLYCFDRIEGKEPDSLQKLGYMAAFFLGYYDDKTMNLDAEDWDEIRETLEDVSGDIDLNTLTELMAALLERGSLGDA